jgi:hypothetical protein
MRQISIAIRSGSKGQGKAMRKPFVQPFRTDVRPPFEVSDTGYRPLQAFEIGNDGIHLIGGSAVLEREQDDVAQRCGKIGSHGIHSM